MCKILYAVAETPCGRHVLEARPTKIVDRNIRRLGRGDRWEVISAGDDADVLGSVAWQCSRTACHRVKNYRR